MRNRNDIGSRCHDLTHPSVAKLNDRVDQFAFFFLDDTFGFTDVDERLQVVAIVVIVFFVARDRRLVLATRSIEKLLERIGDESHCWHEWTDDRQQKQERLFRIAS